MQDKFFGVKGGLGVLRVLLQKGIFLWGGGGVQGASKAGVERFILLPAGIFMLHLGPSRPRLWFASCVVTDDFCCGSLLFVGFRACRHESK